MSLQVTGELRFPLRFDVFFGVRGLESWDAFFSAPYLDVWLLSGDVSQSMTVFLTQEVRRVILPEYSYYCSYEKNHSNHLGLGQIMVVECTVSPLPTIAFFIGLLPSPARYMRPFC